MMSSCVACEDPVGFDPGFKLFGKTILDFKDEKKPENPIVVQSSSCEQTKQNPIAVQSSSCEQTKVVFLQDKGGEEEVGSCETEKTVLKKPDKLLPCPRCESMDTKFCYYNNYNVNQPRHFCKNCQRYWTAGGSLRNVPVGAGRRKNKQPSSCSSSMASTRQLRSALEDYDNPIRPMKLGRQSIQIDGSNPGGTTVLNFGPDGKNILESRDEISCGSSVTAEMEAQAQAASGHVNSRRPNGAVAGCPPVPLFTGPWPYGWNVNPGPWGPIPWPMVPGTPWTTGPWVPAPWPMGPVPASSVPATVGTNNNQAQGKRGNGGLCVPKTLRIDDPGEAAQSSIWASLGLGSTECRASSFKAFKPKTEVHSAAASQAFRANPAAFSRSMSFQESN